MTKKIQNGKSDSVGIFKIAASAVQAVFCYILSVGTLILAVSFLRLPFDIGYCFLISLPVSAVLGIVSYNKKVLLVFSLSAAVLALLAFLLSPSGFKAFFVKYFKLCVDSFLSYKAIEINRDVKILGLLLCVISGIFSFVFPRGMRLNFPIIVIDIALLAVNLIFTSEYNTILGTALVISGYFPIISNKYSTKGNYNFNSKKYYIAKITAVVISSLICLVICGSVTALFREDTSDYHYRPCSDSVADIQSVTQLYDPEETDIASVTLHDLGLQPDKNHIGGNLDPDRPSFLLALAEDSKSRLFRVTSFDYYNGKSWSQSDTEYYRLDGNFQKQRNISINTLKKLENNKEYNSIIGEDKISISLCEPSNLLVANNDIYNFTEEVKSNNTLIFDYHGQIMSPWEQKKGYKYSYSVFDIPGSDGIIDGSAADVLARIEEENMSSCPGYIKDLYLQVPDYWSYTFQKLGSSLTKKTRIETIKNCQKYLNELGYTYTETPGDIIYTYTPVDQMIYEKSGYCVQYATALCMLLRSNNIPSRLAAGYRSVKYDGSRYALFADNAYTWVEAFVNGIGWINVDASPQSKNAIKHFVLAQPQSKEENTDVGDIPKPQDKKEETADVKLKKNTDKEQSNPMIIILIIAVAVVLIFVLFANLMLSERVIFAAIKNPQKIIRLYYALIVYFIRLFKKQTANYTFGDISDAALLICESKLVNEAFSVFNKVCYSQYTATKSDALVCSKAFGEIKAKVKANISPIKYIIKCKIIRSDIFKLIKIMLF